MILSNKRWVQVMIPITEVLIRLIGVQRTISLICKPQVLTAEIKDDDFKAAKLLLRALKTGVEQTYWKGNCLSRSIVLQKLLLKNSIKSDFYIGVRKKPKFKAHAWVECNGQPLNADKIVRKNYQIINNYQPIQRAKFS